MKLSAYSTGKQSGCGKSKTRQADTFAIAFFLCSRFADSWLGQLQQKIWQIQLQLPHIH